MDEPFVPIAERRRPDERMTLDDDRTALSLADAAAHVGLSIKTLRRAYSTGALKAYQPTGRNGYRVTVAELERWYLGKPKGDRP